MIVAVGSWRGTGATTLALLAATCLAAGHEQGAWLVEADPAGGVLAGRMRLDPAAVGGLESVAFPSRRGPVAELFGSAAHTTGGLRIVGAPADPFRAFACHQPRVPWVLSLRELPGSVVVDVGTLRAGSPVWPLLTSADAVVLVAAPEVSAAVAAAEWLQAGGRVSPAEQGLIDGNARIAVVDSPGGVAFQRATLLAQLGDRCCGWLPWEPPAVDLVLRGAAPDDRRLRRSALMTGVHRLVRDLATDVGSGR